MLAAVFGLKAREKTFSEEELRTLLPLARDSKRALIIIARGQEEPAFEQLSTEIYDKACSLVTPDSDYAGRITIAREAAERCDWNTVITLLDGYVSLEEDSEELHRLALAFANITPPRERGVEFYKTPSSFVAAAPICFVRRNIELQQRCSRTGRKRLSPSL